METFQAQLEQVEQAVKADPSNTELTSLAEELKELISLTEQSIAAVNPSKATSSANSTSAPAKSSSSTPGASSTSASTGKPAWVAGDECLAKYSGDDKWYPARVTSVGGSEEKRVYSVVFRGYNSTELVAPNALKRLSPSQMMHYNNTSSALPSSGTKRKLDAEEEAERERKKKKNEKKLVVRAAKAQEQDSKKASWQKFATKSVKKGVGIAGVAGTSIFKTPDNPLGKGESYFSIISYISPTLQSRSHRQRQGHDRGPAAKEAQVYGDRR